jgi:flagellar M-ring protein FliF
MERIGNILSPLVGDGMRVQVSADVDFTETDKTQEMFNPQSSVLRSEQTSEEKNASAAIQGVPGALSNQPTPAGAAPDPSATANTANTANTPSTSNTASTGDTGSSSKNATRNFELDKTITRTRLATGVLRRLSVAVVVDDQHTIQEDGKVIPKPYTPEDINRFSDLVKQAVGFDSTRGDQVTVNNVAFKIPDALEALPEVPMWKQGWFFDVIKQVGAGLAVILLIFFVLRPVMRSLAGSTIVEKEVQSLKEQQAMIASGGHVNGHDPLSLPEATPVPGLARQGSEALPIHMDDLLLIDVPHSYEARLEYLQRVVDNDPKLVAQVIKRWVR